MDIHGCTFNVDGDYLAAYPLPWNIKLRKRFLTKVMLVITSSLVLVRTNG